MKTQIETERKYVIFKPDCDVLKAQKNFAESRIIQIYLESEKGVTRRVRARTKNGVTVYTETVKRRISCVSAEESEREITEEEYGKLSGLIAKGTRPIEKIRCTFDYLGQLFELDFYPQWQRTCVMETELSREDERAVIPEFITVLYEVTGRLEYTNAAMSRHFPSEIV